MQGEAQVEPLATLRNALRREGVIYAPRPKGRKHVTEELIRAAALERSLADVSVVALSEHLSGLKLAILDARR